PPPTSSNGALRLLYVGRLSVEKGVEHLIDACAEVRHCGIAFELSVVGTGPLEQALKRRISVAGLGNCVRLLGALPRQSLGSHYRAADALCVPSLSEPLATVILESLVVGTPVIGTRVGGTPYIVEDGVNGLLVPAGDPSALARAIVRLARERGCLAR